MNTNPDETKLAMWLDDELLGDDLAAFEAGLGSDSQQIAARAEIRRLKQLLTAALPASEEPPYPEFFNHRVAQVIRAAAPAPAAASRVTLFFRRPFWLPVAAGLGMAFTFWLGTLTRSGAPAEVVVEAPPPRAIPVEAFVYTPETGVSVERIASTDATVIVLDGLEAIPDDTDLSAQSSRPREFDSTAAAAAEVSKMLTL